jgi:hypothetical protein
MQERNTPDHRPALADLGGYALTGRQCLLFIGLIGECGHTRTTFGMVSDGPTEEDDCATLRAYHPIVNLPYGQYTREKAEPIVSSLRWVHNGIVAATALRRRLPDGNRHYYL